ncbi:ArsR family transcriptional regulator [Klenkia sp. PcliD-1-E]|uniref:ArsR family transcriptional regulator n=1 Tax=Klenkia sp. PcliD-1-E TaxID=2954492 RepID=UPI0020983BB1|nr:ArsR family transcriptional regulator [Klenkia sp. PcliD-1-E]MCO7220848.1 ArsR family transcriptional regulator [Klenkia sp. PcliD-1-E]
MTYTSQDTEFTLSQLAQRVGASPRAVHAEVDRLVNSGLLVDRRLGRNRLLSAPADGLLVRPLRDLLAVTLGPLPVLTAALGAVAGVQRAFIYGSWAARYSGEPGPPPADIDVLVVGDADPDNLYDVAREAERRLGRPVDIRRVRSSSWDDESSQDPFLASLRSRPLVELDLIRSSAEVAS